MTGNRSEPKGSWVGWGAEAASSSEEWLRGTWGRGQWDPKAQEVGKTAASEEGSDQVRVADRIVFSERFFHHLWCYLCIPLKLQTLMFLSWKCWTETIHFQDQGTQNFPNEAALDLCVSWNRRRRRAMRGSCLEEIFVILLGNDLIFLIIFRNVMATLSSWNFRSSVHFCFPSHSPSLFLFLPSNHSSSSPFFFYFFLSPITWKTVISGFKGKAFHMATVKMWSCLLILHLELSKHWPWHLFSNGRHPFDVMIMFNIGRWNAVMHLKAYAYQTSHLSRAKLIPCAILFAIHFSYK